MTLYNDHFHFLTDMIYPTSVCWSRCLLASENITKNEKCLNSAWDLWYVQPYKWITIQCGPPLLIHFWTAISLPPPHHLSVVCLYGDLLQSEKSPSTRWHCHAPYLLRQAKREPEGYPATNKHVSTLYTGDDFQMYLIWTYRTNVKLSGCRRNNVLRDIQIT